jgi:RNA polymerase sigma-70 factor (ECF subfamily)
MTGSSSTTVQIQAWVDRVRGGDELARRELLNVACERLRTLAHRMIRSFPRIQRWEDTNDVLQNAALRLCRTLQHEIPQDAEAFLRLAALNIRRELLDLVKHYYGPQGHGARHATNAGEAAPSGHGIALREPADLSLEPGRLAAWSEFHRQVDCLPDEEREVFDLLWYQGLSQAEAASMLKVSERTIKRRWQTARLRLHEALKGEMPE